MDCMTTASDMTTSPVDGDWRRMVPPSDPCAPALPAQGSAGTSAGVNIAPGSDDDGWVVPPPVALEDGSTVQLYKDGEALHAAMNAIRSARHRVCLESYIFADDDTGHHFAELLCQKARAGMKVFVIFDSFGSMTPTVLWKRKPEMFARMRAAGVRLQEFHPFRPWEGGHSWRPLNRDHRKLLVCDDNIAGLGGLNVGQEYAGSWVINPRTKCDPWRDNAIGVRGPAARQLLHAFARSWNYGVHGGRIGRAEYRCNLREGAFGILASVPTTNSPLRPFFKDLLGNARKSIDMTMAYFAPDDDLVNALLRAAGRGARVRLMLPSRSDVHALIAAARSFYQRLMDAGIEIYERQVVVLHAKTMTVDGYTSVVGSANLDTRSIEFNLELSAIVRNAKFAAQMEDLFENDIRYAVRIDPEQWRSRPWRDRAVQWAVSRARYLL
jgi:cardiolipin synthase